MDVFSTMLAQSLANVVKRKDAELTLFEHIVGTQPHHALLLSLEKSCSVSFEVLTTKMVGREAFGEKAKVCLSKKGRKNRGSC